MWYWLLRLIIPTNEDIGCAKEKRYMKVCERDYFHLNFSIWISRHLSCGNVERSTQFTSTKFPGSVIFSHFKYSALYILKYLKRSISFISNNWIVFFYKYCWSFNLILKKVHNVLTLTQNLRGNFSINKFLKYILSVKYSMSRFHLFFFFIFLITEICASACKINHTVYIIKIWVC